MVDFDIEQIISASWRIWNPVLLETWWGESWTFNWPVSKLAQDLTYIVYYKNVWGHQIQYQEETMDNILNTLICEYHVVILHVIDYFNLRTTLLDPDGTDLSLTTLITSSEY